MKLNLSQEDKLVVRYSEFKLAFLTVILLFFIIFPLLLPARINIQTNSIFVIAVIITWLISALIYLFAHLSKGRGGYAFLRYATVITDIIFLSAILYVLAGINSNYFFLFAFIIIGASFYLDRFLIVLAGILSVLIIAATFFFETQFPLNASGYLLFAIRLAFIILTTYFVYLFVLSYEGIIRQKHKIEKISFLNEELLAHFSHQLRAPLPVIRDFIELLFLEKAGPLNEKQKKILATLHNNTKHLIEESSSAIYLTQLKNGELYLKKKKSNIVELVGAVIKRAVEEEISKSITISYLPKKKVITSSLDSEKMPLAFYFLISSIISRAEPGSTIGIITYDSPYSKFCQIKFSYLGESLPPMSTLKRRNIQLYIASKIITLHGGNLNLSAMGKKQKIVITLPSE